MCVYVLDTQRERTNKSAQSEGEAAAERSLLERERFFGAEGNLVL